jgi:hypothetical protein
MWEGGESWCVVVLMLLLLELNIFAYPSSLCFLQVVKIVMPSGDDLIRLTKVRASGV